MRTRAEFVTTIFVLVTTMLTLPCVGDDLPKYKERASSDDANTIEEALFHRGAKALVIRNVQPNKLGVGGNEFRVKRNPVGKGCFVYDPRTKFNGAERPLVWWVIDEKAAYALNSPSKIVTPGLKWPREDGFHSPSTPEILGYVFKNEPIPPPKPIIKTSEAKGELFSVKEYTIYRYVIDAPIPEPQAMENVGKRHGMSNAEVKQTVRKVQTILSQNNWFSSPSTEIKHASDWKDERP